MRGLLGTLEKPGCCGAWQTTKNDGLPYGDAGFSSVAMPAGWQNNTLEKPGCSAAGQTTKNDGLPHGDAGWHNNTPVRWMIVFCRPSAGDTSFKGLPST